MRGNGKASPRLKRLHWKPVRQILPLILASLALVGCVSEQKKQKQPEPSYQPGKTAIQELNLLAVPVALNLDGIPGPDGFVVKIYAGNPKEPKPIPIGSGTLDIFMFDGIIAERDLSSIPPRHAWNFKAKDLKNYEIKTSIGTGYQIISRWEDARPAQDKITIIARYTSSEKTTVYSAPSVISITMQ